MRIFLSVLFSILIVSDSFAQNNWQLKKESNGMKIYTGDIAGSNVKALKVVYTVDGRLSSLAALLLDVNAQDKWVYSTKRSYLVNKKSDNEIVYYSEKSMPFPVSNRDVVVSTDITQASNKVMTVDIHSVKSTIPEKKDVVRVPYTDVKWVVTPTANGKLAIEYVAKLDPGGSVPAWLVNMFCTKGPYETFSKLTAMLQQPAYKNASLSFIKD